MQPELKKSILEYVLGERKELELVGPPALIATIYEAAFFYDDVMAALDILHHQNGERWAIEVKSSKDVKDYHITALVNKVVV